MPPWVKPIQSFSNLRNCQLRSFNTIHDISYPIFIHTNSFKSVPYKRPLEAVIGFLYINLNFHKAYIPFLLSHHVNNRSENNNIVSYLSTKVKATLVWTDHLWEDGFNLLAKVLVIILWLTLHKLIGLSWATFSRWATLGIRASIVLLVSIRSVLEVKNFKINSEMVSTNHFPSFFGRSLLLSHLGLMLY